LHADRLGGHGSGGSRSTLRGSFQQRSPPCHARIARLGMPPADAHASYRLQLRHTPRSASGSILAAPAEAPVQFQRLQLMHLPLLLRNSYASARTRRPRWIACTRAAAAASGVSATGGGDGCWLGLRLMRPRCIACTLAAVAPSASLCFLSRRPRWIACTRAAAAASSAACCRALRPLWMACKYSEDGEDGD
jgi:hypothetical protein